MKGNHSTISFSFQAKGHRNIRASHKSTLELTTDSNVTKKGDCIIGVSSTHGLNDLPDEIKTIIKLSSSLIIIILKIGENEVKITGQGNPNLSLSHVSDIVARKSSFTCSRTLCINSSHAAADLPIEFVDLLKEDTIIDVRIEVLANYY
ncbi:MAG: DUF371 domain-containing protein [Candidatus Heimdallarchaeota archaeon]|nr:DUF371 domain-containing protein [Candidatus Heimdallarchaeota archaeon]MCK5047751.1 DUF371 domain-containing protein [Candidatus Heimdallarchaeota archaeon]